MLQEASRRLVRKALLFPAKSKFYKGLLGNAKFHKVRMKHNKCGEKLYDATKPQRIRIKMRTPHYLYEYAVA